LVATVDGISGLEPAGVAWIIVDGKKAYRAGYRAQSQDGILLGLHIVYVT
jgi:hypothetical protein